LIWPRFGSVWPPAKIGPPRATLSLVVLTGLVLGLFGASSGFRCFDPNLPVNVANDGAFLCRLEVLQEDAVRKPGLYRIDELND
jgi:hypothetical protein